MATSGTDTWNPQLVFIIRQALLNATAIDENDAPTNTLYYDALFQLNAMVKTLEATGIHVWTEEEAILFLQSGQAKYVIGVGAGLPAPLPIAHTSDADQWLELVLAQPIAAGGLALTVVSAAGVAAGMKIGVVDNNGLTQWTTVNGAPVGNVITLTAGLVGAGAAAGNFALAYTTEISRPLKVPRARLLTLNGLTETTMTVLSRQEYMDLPNKLNTGVPTQFFYSPQRDQGYLYAWPVPSTSAWAVRFTWYRPLQDYLLPTNTLDFPQEWILPLIWNLAKEMAPSYGVPDATWTRITTMADNYAMLAISYDRESEDIQFGMDESR